MSHVLPAQSRRPDGHDILCVAQERPPDIISARLPSCGNGDIDVECNQVSRRRPLDLHWFYKLNNSHRYVQLLSADRIQS